MDTLRGFGDLGLGSRLKRISEFMMRETQLVYDEFNIDFDPYLFAVFKIIENNKGVNNNDIKNSLNTSQPAVTQTLNKLLKKGLIKITEDKNDKRKKKIQLSNKGKKLVTDITPVWESIEFTIKRYTKITSNSLVEHLNILENKFEEERFSKAIINHINMNAKIKLIEIISYKNEYAPHFYEFNIEWLQKYFYVEPYDEEVLSNPEKYIINKGGFVFFAKLNNNIVGTVALMPTKDGLFELTKMAVSPKYRGFKIGQKLMQHCISFAKNKGLESLILYSSRKLENAIYIYRKYGFVEIPVEKNSPYERSDIKMVLKL
ncbi:bifunctional helix-turn-helix transcriptional regulator/GNAT family N-acetyltransferase [uncultured Polaribacter sp.]|uniref:bifunctional helix-turn-helix transcriptional regulator/GNAT family N-acetyltransferase n=1 Tax=uncultured Polaribacter sp. TaxID=174711 RepID=UPI0034226BFD